MLGQEGEWQLTNRELAQRLGVDPGHLHFHVRMLLKAGLIELADNEKGGREKPYRSVARTFRIAPELLAAGGASDIQAAMLDQVQRAHALYRPERESRHALAARRREHAPPRPGRERAAPVQPRSGRSASLSLRRPGRASRSRPTPRPASRPRGSAP